MVIYKERQKKFNNNLKNKVEEHSAKIVALKTLNEATFFHQAKDLFQLYKYYDNKLNFQKIEPTYILLAEIKTNMDFFTEYVRIVCENRQKYRQYQFEIEKILKMDYSIDYEKIGIPKSFFDRCEANLLSDRILCPVLDCTFYISMMYSSPRRRVNLQKEAFFNFDDLFACFESVSGDWLDKNIYLNLAAVERGEVSDSLRYDILHRDGFKCVICGTSAKQGARLHVDHIIPISKGGRSIPSNLRTLCERCNLGKSNKIEMDEDERKNNRYKCNLTCSICGEKLVLRKGRYGTFYGCSNYPKCKFTRQL